MVNRLQLRTWCRVRAARSDSLETGLVNRILAMLGCFESCYWHLIEKHFCYDESIALYEDPLKPEKHNNSFENMAFYDQVALIAGRSIVTIEPLPNKPRPIEHQPVRRIRWWEDNVDEQNKQNEAKNRETRSQTDTTTQIDTRGCVGTGNQGDTRSQDDIRRQIDTRSHDDTKNQDDTRSQIGSNTNQVDPKTQTDTRSIQSIPIIVESSTEDLTSSTEQLDRNVDVVDSGDKNETKTDQSPVLRKSSSTLETPEQQKNRKKSLRERRMSRSLTINIDRNLELPVIKQVSMPKFYIDTPEVNQLDTSILMVPSLTLTSPVMPRTSPNDYFDLRSVVQIEKEHRAHVPVHKQPSASFRLSQFKEKLKSTKLKRQSSATNLPNSIQHI